VADGSAGQGSGEMAETVLDLLATRGPGKTICPSEVARRLGGDHWRPWMEPVRETVNALAASGSVEVTQHGQVVDPTTARGPIRVRSPQPNRSAGG
jgi:hypothetical protein